MAFHLMDAINEYLTPGLIKSTADHLGESSTNVTKAISAAVPTLLGGFINTAESGGSAELLSDAKDIAASGLTGRLGGLFNGSDSSLLNMGTSLLNSVFGSKLGSVISSISNFAGIRNVSTNSLLSMLAPLALGVLGKHASENNLTSTGLTGYLTGQKNALMSALPSGFGLSSLFDGFSHETKKSAAVQMAYDAPKRRNYFWPVLLAIGGIVLLGYLLSRGCHNDKEMVASTTNDTTTVAVPPPITTIEPQRESMKVKLADGTEIDAYKGGIEDQLAMCLNDKTCMAGKDKWFDFDNINFEMASAKLTVESDVQIKNIAAILKAYPHAKIKIGGYTDKTGDSITNKKLSQERADAVLDALKATGANPAQLIGAEGYGSAFAKIDASASDDERRVDRRISVQLREK